MPETDIGIAPTLAELLRLQVEARRLGFPGRRSSALDAGGRHSRFRGRGIDFQESREYQPGDDIRSIDWRVTARSGKPHTKVYTEERDRPVHLLLDANPSMFFGTRTAFKSVLAARLAALLGWATIQRGDRIGALLFNAEHHLELPAAGGRRGMMRLLRALLDWYRPIVAAGPSAGGLAGALQRLRRTGRPGGLIVMISDFYILEDELATQLAGLRRHQDLLACRIADPLELAPPPPGRYAISDGVRTLTLDMDSAAWRERYQRHCAAGQQNLTTLLARYAVPLITLTTRDDPVTVLQRGPAPPPNDP